MQTIYLEPAQVPAALRASYSGKKFKAQVCESVDIPADAGLWDHGSRSHYFAVELQSGAQVAIPGQASAPWDESRRSQSVALKPGFAIVLHRMFSGQDMGLTFYIHPVNAAAMLPPSVDLSDVQKIVLKATRDYKASYNGQDRYDLAKPYSRDALALYPSREQWEAAKASLIAGGFLNKAGAITVKGRNAI